MKIAWELTDWIPKSSISFWTILHRRTDISVKRLRRVDLHSEDLDPVIKIFWRQVETSQSFHIKLQSEYNLTTSYMNLGNMNNIFSTILLFYAHEII